MSKYELIAEHNLFPACHQDLLDGKQLYRIVGNQLVEFHCPNLDAGQHCSTLVGETVLFNEGHLHKRKYRGLDEYHSLTQSSPTFWIKKNE